MMTERISHFNNTTAIIVAGGLGRRMKKDKKFLQTPEGSLIDVVINNLKYLFKEIIISVSKESGFKRDGYRVVRDIDDGYGPLMGIYSGLKATSSAVNFIIAVDIPEIDYDLLKEMFGYTKHYDIVVPVSRKGKFEPLYSFIRKNTLYEIERMLDTGKNKILLLYEKCKTKQVKIKRENSLKNLNTPEDYERYLKEMSRID